MKSREREYFTITSEIRTPFLDYINENNINKSKLIEKLIRDYLISKDVIEK